MRLPCCWLSVGALPSIAVVSAGAAPSKRFHYTHLVGVTGQLVDHWTINDSDYCGRVGDGTVTVDYHTTRPAMARPFIDPYAGAEQSSRAVAGCSASRPEAGSATCVRSAPRGRSRRVDNTRREPPPTGGDCGGGHDKSGVRNRDAGGADEQRAGLRPHRLLRRSAGAEIRSHGSGRAVACDIGEVDDVQQPPSSPAASRRGELSCTWRAPRRRPSPTRAGHGLGHKHSALQRCGSATTAHDDVTRTVTVTFKRSVARYAASTSTAAAAGR